MASQPEAKVNLKALDRKTLADFLHALGEPAFRTTQIWQWLWQKGAVEFAEMTNLSRGLREKLAAVAWIGSLKILAKQVSKLDGTAKYLFGLPDGETVESVLMLHNYGQSVCVSTQVGCQMGCGFCASTLGGMVRNLEAWEIYDQVLRIQEDAGIRVSSVVLMGSGEPLENYSNVIAFIRLITAPDCLNIGQRHLTLSTCGIVPKIYELADEGLEITLSISLHSADAAVRSKIMPVNRRYPLVDLIKACKAYLTKTKRRITFEYSLLAGVNDSAEAAHSLGILLKGMLCHVNLIAVNPVAGRGFKRPATSQIRAFQQIVESYGIETTLRRELGTDIDAACGQLRRRLGGKL